jgi:F-type H+-transporting ATPase subunit b
MQITLNENFWIAVSFLVFVGLAFTFVKRSVMQVIDIKIQSINKSVSEAQYIKDKAHEELIHLKNEYQKTLEKSHQTVEDAKSDAQNFIQAAQKQIMESNTNIEKLLNDYQKKAESKMIETLKNDVIVTVISIIEAEILDKQKNTQYTNQLDDSRRLLKKIWN